MALSETSGILCRDQQQRLLLSLFGERSCLVVPSIFVFGHTATGKTLTLNGLLTGNKLPHVHVNCVEAYNERILYECILSGISRWLPDATSPPATVQETCCCTNASDFVRLFKDIITQRKLDQETVYIVLDKADRLRNLETNVLPALLRLQELVAGNVTSILVSEVAWERFRSFPTGLHEPLIVHFPDYSKEELFKIMECDRPEEFPPAFYSNYVRIIVNIFYIVTRSLQELRYMAAINFAKYSEPVRKGEADVTNLRLLWKHAEPYFRASMRTVYLRELSSKQWEELQQHDLCAQGPSCLQLATTPTSSLELPFFSKFLLTAAYLASYNPAKSDTTFFVKNSSKRKKSKILGKKQRTNNQLLGPKPFPLDRLLAIFYSIVDSNVPPTANLFCQISSLVTMQLLAHVGSSRLDAPKYKCLVNLDFMKGVCRTIHFDIIKYLYDFV